MKRVPDESGSRLDEALDLLSREIAPQSDLWPAIEARLEPRDGRRHARWRWAAAAAVLLVAGSSLVTAILLRREAPAVADQAQGPGGGATVAAVAFGPGQTLDPAYLAARQDLVRGLTERIGRLPPEARTQLERNLAELRRATAEINAALELKPGDPLLEELLLATYQEELAVLASVNQLTAGNGAGGMNETTRMQL